MFPEVDTRSPLEVQRACIACWRDHEVPFDPAVLTRGFDWILSAFAGRHADYEPLDLAYHDLEHTLQATLCLARLLAGWWTCGGPPALDARAIRLGLLAVLFHDTGYLKARGDHAGTGAKFTRCHVARGAALAERVLAREGLPPADLLAIQNMIRCTGLNADPGTLAFESPVHRLVGCALATADLLGQMAAPDYLEKLPRLQAEFVETCAADPDAGPAYRFRDATELLEKTAGFWSQYVHPRLEGVYQGTYRFLAQPPPDGPNAYLDRIHANLARIPGLLARSRARRP